jgi:hypothetical protein
MEALAKHCTPCSAVDVDSLIAAWATAHEDSLAALAKTAKANGCELHMLPACMEHKIFPIANHIMCTNSNSSIHVISDEQHHLNQADLTVCNAENIRHVNGSRITITKPALLGDGFRGEFGNALLVGKIPPWKERMLIRQIIAPMATTRNSTIVIFWGP